MQKDKRLVVVFLVVIFGVFLCIPSKFILVKMGIMSMNMDNFSEYKGNTEKNIVDKLNNIVGKMENNIENKVTNYFPLYSNLNTLYQRVNFASNKLLFKDVPIKTNSDGEYIFYDKVNEFYYLTNKYSDEELDARLEKQVKFFNELSNKGINVNIYIPTRYEFTELKENNLSKFLDEFVNKLDSKINTRVMNVTSIDEYKKYFYKTDHHWTIYGALDGYQDICDMLGIQKLNDLNALEHKEKKYYGSLAKTALNDSINDYISDVDIKLDYDVYVNGKETDKLFKPREIRLDRDYKYYDYYVISTRLEKQKFEIETEKFDILSKYYIKEFEYRKNWKCPISEDMKEFLYKNVNFFKLDSLRLIVFVKMIQTKDLIKAVLNTNDITFINDYLSKIDKIKNTEFNDIYRLIGTYKRDNNINRKAMNNLRTLTKNKKYLNYLDGRKRLEAIVS